MLMRIIAVDDEKAALEILLDCIKNVEDKADIKGFLLPETAVDYAEKNVCDIAFVDVEMPQMNGMDLAHKLKKINPCMNIIFVTAYKDYSMSAFELHASGYVLKPVTESAIKREMDNLRFPIACDYKDKGIRAVTFGQFDLYVNGEIVHFGRAKSKELLAFLIDRHGGGVTKKEIAGALFEDEAYTRNIQDYLNKIVKELAISLREAGAEEILIKEHNYYAVEVNKFSCDLYEYEKGEAEALNAFRGEYMTQYSFGETTLGRLLD